MAIKPNCPFPDAWEYISVLSKMPVKRASPTAVVAILKRH